MAEQMRSEGGCQSWFLFVRLMSNRQEPHIQRAISLAAPMHVPQICLDVLCHVCPSMLGRNRKPLNKETYYICRYRALRITVDDPLP